MESKELLEWIRDRWEYFGNLDIVRDEEIYEELNRILTNK